MTETLDKIKTKLDTVTDSFKDSVKQGFAKAGGVTQPEAQKILNNGGKILDSNNPGADLNSYISDYSGVYRLGLLLVVVALAVLSLTRMLPTEQFVRVVKN